MSYFSTALARLAAQSGLKQADLVRESGLTRSHVSRLFTGEQRTVTDEDFCALLRALPDAPARAALIAARCMDARVGPGAELVQITVRGEDKPPQAAGLPEVELAPETEKAFAWLRSQCPLNPELERHLVGYARLTGMK